jgi:hypothetical protein
MGVIAGEAVGCPIRQTMANQDQFHASTLVPPMRAKSAVVGQVGIGLRLMEEAKDQRRRGFACHRPPRNLAGGSR